MGVILGSLFIIGLIVGSFYNVVALRLCKNESIIFPGSHCINCNHELSWYELIPVFSYLFLKGKCKKCKSHISIQYPLIELLTGVLFVISFLRFGFSYETLVTIVLSSIILIVIVTDFKYMIILDEVLIVSLILFFVLFTIFVNLKFALLSLVKGLVIYLVVLLIKIFGDRVYKQESLGWGDVKISFLAGMILGVKLGLIYIFLASFIALPYAIVVSIKNKNNVLPFGPFLAVSMYILYMFSNYANLLISFIIGVK